MEQFSKESSKLSYLSKDFEILDKQTKPKLVESLMIALTALHLADSYMKKTIWYYFKINGWIDEADWINQNAYWNQENW